MPLPGSPANTPLVLVIRDGWGRNPHPEHAAFDAIRLAETPVADALEQIWPTTLIRTCGEDVGLPAGTMGNSEVGHQNIGAGRIVDQQLMRITRAIRDGRFGNAAAFTGAFEHLQRTGGTLHLLGLVSDGLVHSDIEHLEALIDLAAARKLPADRLCVHVITDGRDVPPGTAPGFIDRVEAKLRDVATGRIASVLGRYWAMDRDHRWGRIAVAWSCLTGRPLLHKDRDTKGVAPRTAGTAQEAVAAYYAHPSEPSRAGDEFILPCRIGATDAAGNPPPGRIGDGDAVIFFNFRGDRPREITRAFVFDDDAWQHVQGGGFERGPQLRDLYFCTMADYEEGLPVEVAFARPPKMPDILGEVIAEYGLTQFRCAETEKFPHVTFFFNDYREEPFPGERRLLLPSPQDVTTYDQKPEMSAAGVRDGVLARLAADDCEPLIVVNFANADMVGHTGNLPAVVRAVEVVDACVGQITGAVLARGGSAIVTADHGNAEQMWLPELNAPHTAHTTYDVPLIVVGQAFDGLTLRDGGRLGDIAPTILAMMQLAQPTAMTGRSLV